MDLEVLNEAFGRFIPYNRLLGLHIVEVNEHTGVVLTRLPYRPELVGNPDTGVLHGGVLTSLIDATSGIAVFVSLDAPVPIATLDLRVDMLEPSTPERDVFARAECFRRTRNVGFVRAEAYHEVGRPIATAAATFMLSTKGQLLSGAR